MKTEFEILPVAGDAERRSCPEPLDRAKDLLPWRRAQKLGASWLDGAGSYIQDSSEDGGLLLVLLDNDRGTNIPYEIQRLPQNV